MGGNKGTFSIDTLFQDECITILKLFIESGVLSPSQIISISGISRGRTYVCLNKLLRNRLIRKIGKGKYEITKDGKRLLNILATYFLGGNYILGSGGGLSAEEYMILLKRYLGGLSIDKYLLSIAETVRDLGIISQEEIILLLSYLLEKDGVGGSFGDLSKRLLFIKDFSKEALVRDVHRKLLEYSFHSRILRMVTGSIVEVRELDKSTPQPYVVYAKEVGNEPNSKYVVYFSHQSSLNLRNYYRVIINVDWFSYSKSVYTLIRRAAGNAIYVLHDIPDDVYDDELTINMVMNDSNRGVGVYLYKSMYGSVVVDDEGFGISIDQLDTPIYNISKLVIDVEKVDGWTVDALASSIFTRSLITYVDVLKKFYGLSEDDNTVVYICLKGLDRGVELNWYVDWLQFIQEEAGRNGVLVYPYLHVDFAEASEHLNSIYNSLGYVGFPPKKYRPLDVFDLKYLLKKALEMDYAFFNLVD